VAVGALLFAHALTGCGGESESDVGTKTPYDPNYTVVYGDPSGGGGEFRTPDGTDCIQVAGSCIRPQEACGDNGTADVIVDEQGNVLDTICYGQEVTVDAVPIDVVDTATAGNNTVLVIDGADDGDDVTGDVVIEGNNAIVYGEGPDTSIIGGSLDIQKNNAIIRGVRIRGDVTIDKNDTKMVYCVIEGDLTIAMNNTTIADCEVWGTVTIGMNNSVLAQNRFNGIDSVSAANAQCVGNERFDDLNMDFVVTDDEVTGPVVCTE
jgi:hypothetical protein